MSQKPQIKIVKRGRPAEAEQKPRADAEKDARRGARAVAENVSAWVEEFRKRRTADAARSFSSLFA